MRCLIVLAMLFASHASAPVMLAHAQEAAPVEAAAEATAEAPEEAKPAGNKVIEMLPEGAQRWARIILMILGACFPLATAITALTKSPNDDKWVGKAQLFFEKWFSFAKRNPGGGVRVSYPSEETGI